MLGSCTIQRNSIILNYNSALVIETSSIRLTAAYSSERIKPESQVGKDAHSTWLIAPIFMTPEESTARIQKLGVMYEKIDTHVSEQTW